MDLQNYQHVLGHIKEAMPVSACDSWDEEVRTSIHQLGDEILSISGFHPYVAEKISDLKIAADVFHSPGQHRHYDRPDETGRAVMRGRMLSAVGALSDWPDVRRRLDASRHQA